ncbi:hypothetical protein ABZ897_43615 [Nonomuraea sp. NPDC046802]|uniref:hypothetical protein n=1 Tax=Nonomuraea sp. NPDC046802 TaxID=3154919 RepID=UPI0033FE5751
MSPLRWMGDRRVPKTADRRPSYDELASLVVRQMETIEAQRTTIARLEAMVERLTAKIAELERRQNRNSGTPRYRRPAVPSSGRTRSRHP